MRRGDRVAPPCPPSTSPNLVGCVLSPGPFGPPKPPGGRTPRSWRWRRGRRPAGAPCTRRSNLATVHGRTAPWAPTRIVGPGRRPGSWSASKTPTAAVAAGCGPAGAIAGIEVTVGVLADESRRQLRPISSHRRPARPWVVLSWLDDRRPYSGARWVEPVDSRARKPAGRAPLGPRATRCSWAPARAGRRPSSPCELWPAGSARVVIGRFGRMPVSSRARARGDLGDVLDELGGKGECCQVLSERRDGGHDSSGRAWSTATSCTWPRRCSVATTPGRCSGSRRADDR